jgi:hypothetical protein
MNNLIESRLYNKIKSNFCIRGIDNEPSNSNLNRVNELPNNYTLREEYVRCGKDKTRDANRVPTVHITSLIGERNLLMGINPYQERNI